MVPLRDLGIFFREDPVFVPEVAPDGEEAGRDKEADVGADAEVIEAADDGVVEAEADGFDKDVAGQVLDFAEVLTGWCEGPVALD